MSAPETAQFPVWMTLQSIKSAYDARMPWWSINNLIDQHIEMVLENATDACPSLAPLMELGLGRMKIVQGVLW